MSDSLSCSSAASTNDNAPQLFLQSMQTQAYSGPLLHLLLPPVITSVDKLIRSDTFWILLCTVFVQILNVTFYVTCLNPPEGELQGINVGQVFEDSSWHSDCRFLHVYLKIHRQR